MNIYNYNHLYYFYVVAKLSGITVAAKHLNTSQSSLSSQMKTLEATLKRPLFKKVGRKIELTDFGIEVFNYCRRSFEVFDEMFDQINKKSFSTGARISIGVATDIDRPFITDSLSKVSKLYAKNRRPLLNLISLSPAHLEQLIKLGELDILLTPRPTFSTEVKTIISLDLPVGLFAPPELAIQHRKKNSEPSLFKTQLPFVLPSNITYLRTEIDRFVIKKKLSLPCVFESNILASVIRASSDGLGATILPEAYVSRELKAKKLIQLNARPLWKHRIYILSNRRNLSEEKTQFADQLVEHFTA